MYKANINTPKETDTNTRVVGDFNTWISNPERSIRKYWA